MNDLIISDQLIDDLHDLIKRHDGQAEDVIRFAQYLSTISAVVIAEQEAPNDQLENLLQQLFSFSSHVFKQQISEKTPSPYDQEDIYGVWKPTPG